jgi:hypothetical protein
MPSKPSKLASVQVKHVSIFFRLVTEEPAGQMAHKWETEAAARVANPVPLTNEMNNIKIYFLLFPSYLQAIAAVGQGRLMAIYDDLFGQFNQAVAQILLTRNDLADVSDVIFESPDFFLLYCTSPLTRSRSSARNI